TIDDNVVESSGSVTARLRTGPGYMVGTPSSATIVISDNDIPVLPPENLSPTPTATATPMPEVPRGPTPTPTRTPKPTATPVPIEKVDVTQVPGANHDTT
ncbi:MAG: hypothetical protein OXC95_11785, partial [Dehalococcoidia bacterium]|nr:hypothetical protein [Dehalococcoidia bacterium]